MSGIDHLSTSGIRHLTEKSVEVPLRLRVKVHLGIFNDDRTDRSPKLAVGVKDSHHHCALYAQSQLLSGHREALFAVFQAQRAEGIRGVGEPKANVDVG